MIALLGKPDSPTDALADYCLFLGRALEREGHPLNLQRVPWFERGWLAALKSLWRESRSWRGRWVLLQYTALSWSRRGVPFGALAVLRILRMRGAKIAVVFHDAGTFSGTRAKDRFRRAAQRYVMRRAYRVSRVSILTVPLENISWLPERRDKAVFIPVGANFSADELVAAALAPAPNIVVPAAVAPPENPSPDSHDAPENDPRASAGSAPHSRQAMTIAVYAVTGAPELLPETQLIAQVVRRAAALAAQTSAAAPLRLLVLGRNGAEAEAPLRAALAGSGIELEAHGVLPPGEVARRLRAADVLLFVRGAISSSRGSAIAGIVCGLPVVAFSGPETGPPITSAGVLLAPIGDHKALAAALSRVLSDAALRNDLRQRSAAATQNFFSWKAIARRFLDALSL
jgi:glycosyltransferase involved in cell wall biosynthesis